MNENSSVSSKLSTNVGVAERAASIVAGSLLIYNGLKNRDKFTIAKALTGGYLFFRGASGHCELYEAAGKKKLPDPIKNINIRTNVTVNVPRQEAYSFWRKLSNLPLFMEHLESVEKLDGRRSYWKAKVPGHLGTIGWEAEIVKDEEGKLIGWNSLPDSTIENAGKVEFRDAGDGETEIRVTITYRAPLGAVGAGVAKLFNPMFEKIVQNDVKNFKHYIEAGDLPKSKLKKEK
jgi:uncharacterized membrane protein